jgi:ATP-dependent DNA helicase RecG
LADDVYARSIEDTLVSLEVANVTDVGVDIRNIALLMFSDHPEKFMPCAQIELVWFNTPEEEGADVFAEKTFTGPLFRQVKDALDYIKNQVIIEKVVKVSGRAEAERFFNFPYEAIEEALANACQHKSYQIAESVEIRVYLNRIMIINYPGPEPWIDMDEFREGKAVSRRYRNRRIGEFFKEIDLAEKKSTGITKILHTLATNGSPPPVFKTDAERHSLETTIWIHEEFDVDKDVKRAISGGQATADAIVNETGDKQAITGDKQAIKSGDRRQTIIEYLQANKEAFNTELADLLGLSPSRMRDVLKPLIEDGLIEKCGDKKSAYYRLKK